MDPSSSRQRLSLQPSRPEHIGRGPSRNLTSQRSSLTPNTLNIANSHGFNDRMRSDEIQPGGHQPLNGLEEIILSASPSSPHFDTSQSASSCSAQQACNQDSSQNSSHANDSDEGDDGSRLDVQMDGGQPEEEAKTQLPQRFQEFSFTPFDDVVEAFCDVNRFTKILQRESRNVKQFCKTLQDDLGNEREKGARLVLSVNSLKNTRQQSRLQIAQLEKSLDNESSECQRLLQNVETLEGQVLSMKCTRQREVRDKENAIRSFTTQLQDLEMDVAGHEKSLEALKEELIFAQKEVGHEKEAHSNIARRIEESQRKWESQIADEQNTGKDLQHEVDRWTEKVSVLEVAIECSTEEKQLQQKQIADLRAQNVALMEENKSVEKQNEVAHVENNVLVQKLKALELEKTCLEKDKDGARKESKLLREAIASFANAAILPHLGAQAKGQECNLQHELSEITLQGMKQLCALLKEPLSDEDARRTLRLVEVLVKDLKALIEKGKYAMVELSKNLGAGFKQHAKDGMFKLNKSLGLDEVDENLTTNVKAVAFLKSLFDQMLKMSKEKGKKVAEEVRVLTKQVESSQKDMAKYRGLFDDLGEEHKQCIEKNGKELEAIEAAQTKERSIVQAERAKEMKSIKTEHTKVLKSLKAEQVKEVRATRAEHTKEVKGLNSEHANSTKSLRIQFNDKMNTLQAELESEKERADGAAEKNEKLAKDLGDERSKLEVMVIEKKIEAEAYESKIGEESQKREVGEQELGKSQASLERSKSELYRATKLAREGMEEIEMEKQKKEGELAKVLEEKETITNKILEIQAQQLQTKKQVEDVCAEAKAAHVQLTSKLVEKEASCLQKTKEVENAFAEIEKLKAELLVIERELASARISANEDAREKGDTDGKEGKDDRVGESGNHSKSGIGDKTQVQKKISVINATQSKLKSKSKRSGVAKRRALSSSQSSRRKTPKLATDEEDADDGDWVWEKDAQL